MKFFRTAYDENYFSSVIKPSPNQIKRRADLIRSNLPKGKILEVGCGDGSLIKELRKSKSYEITGTDLSEFAVKAARKLTGQKIFLLDIEKNAIRGKYNLIMAFDVLEHLRDPEGALRKMKNALRKDGTVIFSVPNKFGFFGTFATRIMNFIDSTHVSTFRRAVWIAIVKRAGLRPEIMDESIFGHTTSEFTKHLASNLVIIARK